MFQEVGVTKGTSCVSGTVTRILQFPKPCFPVGVELYATTYRGGWPLAFSEWFLLFTWLHSSTLSPVLFIFLCILWCCVHEGAGLFAVGTACLTCWGTCQQRSLCGDGDWDWRSECLNPEMLSLCFLFCLISTLGPHGVCGGEWDVVRKGEWKGAWNICMELVPAATPYSPSLPNLAVFFSSLCS